LLITSGRNDAFGKEHRDWGYGNIGTEGTVNFKKTL
jgi:hypothetical protein